MIPERSAHLRADNALETGLTKMAGEFWAFVRTFICIVDIDSECVAKMQY